ncbi:exodeoxyribonuclease VII large subunit [Pullulanibacillus pueri]|uniref:Exodeoxyribonuclease 7 large subunit n=1 Tax=Pullulanibacillus pueri TaxID=1437324 RepID=A0A8J3ELL4_9BACL|nr:exodeoxyribonuclease VII large subunit [Pullulanibacillus pueri]MBM7681596.1 exodeoxyribonuclease VII large subunit [Pullulanibacillus pueri]GGH79526.1 exodeoxyribonuclease 7 large subunit [Pullulanibacillus pueri]
MAERRYVSVTALTRYIKTLFDHDRRLQDVWIRAEISNFKKHSRGHMYLTLKDTQSRISGVMFAADNRRLLFNPENGMKVLVRGEISVYEPYGQYQIYIKEMQQDGIGNLFLAFEQLKNKLEQEGLFDQRLKKPLPTYPRRIGVVTSPTGAAIRDIFTTIKRRYPVAGITVFPVLVQGEYAAPSIVQAINLANAKKNVDVLIIGRGGGSIEELWAFNEESVARSIHASNLPIISAVGHETDFTISDFVADLRAATPTAAGELVVPHILELQEKVDDRTKRLLQAMKRRLANERERLSVLRNSYAFRYPMQLVRQKEQDLDRAFERITHQSQRILHQWRQRTEHATRLIYKHHPEEQLRQAAKDRENLSQRLERAFKQHEEKKETQLQTLIRQLNALSPLSIMERGYALAYNADQQLVKSVKHINPGESMSVRLQDGVVDCQVWGIEEGDKG